MTLDKNVSPYYDDLNDDKKFLQIMFNPGRPVQARELTQTQSILQKQVERFGNHIFKEGAMIVPGGIGYVFDYPYIALEHQFDGSNITASNFLGKTIYGLTSGAVAEVLNTEELNATEPNTLYLKYKTGDSTQPFTGNITSGSNIITNLSLSGNSYFSVGSIISGSGIPSNTYVVSIDSDTQITISNASTSTTTSASLLKITSSLFEDGEDIMTSDELYFATVGDGGTGEDSVGTGSSATIDSGIYYTKGYFVIVDKQTIILDKYSTTPSYKVGLRINDEFVTYLDDSTLVDPASGFSNFNAPGADRYRIELVLSKYGLTDDIPEDFIELLRLDNGVIQSKVTKTIYSEIGKTLARRTYDESGDYTVRAFPLQIKEHLNDGTNNGKYSASDGGDIDKIVYGIEPGKAYVNGYEIESMSTKFLESDKARTTDSVENSVIPFELGNYVDVDNVEGIFDITEFESVDLVDTEKTDSSYPGSTLGSAKVRSFEFISGTPSTSTAKYRLYIFDISMTGSNSFSSVKAIKNSADSRSCDIVLNSSNLASLQEPTKNIAMLELNNTAIESLSDINYTIKRHYTGVMSGTSITLTAGTNEIFSAFSNSNYQLAIESASGTATGNGYAAGDIIDLSDVANDVSLSGSPVGRQVVITVPDISGSTISVVTTVSKSSVTQKTKTLQTTTITEAYSSTINLDHCDIFDILSITDSTTTEDITSRFTLDNGQRDNFYDIGSISYNTSYPAPAGNVSIEYRYFQHGAGDFFSANSYSGVIDYEDILTYKSSLGKTYNLGDVLDFRPLKNVIGSIALATEIISPGENITLDYNYYLPRIDRVIVTSKGVFKVIKGNPSDNPTAPSVPSNAMNLYDIYLPSYTKDISNIRISRISNKRYTMKDIGKLEERIETLEYYTSLSLLEKDTADMFIDDGTGANRFKSGFLVDNFSSHNVGNVELPDYQCSINRNEGALRPSFISNSIPMEFDTSSSTNYQKTSDFITLPYTIVDFITQPVSSETINVNPFDVFVWIGNMQLSPSSDEWFDTNRLADRIITNDDGLANSLSALNGQTLWNDWQTDWVGERETISTGSTTGSSASSTFNTSLTAIEQGQSRTGTTLGISRTTNTQSFGDRIVSNEFIPWIRSREVDFECNALKPNTKVLPYFDDVLVAEFTKPTGGSYGDDIITDNAGNVTGTFEIPNTDEVRFRTGERVLKLIDDNDPNFSETSAEATYTASGILNNIQETILSTRSARITASSVTAERTVLGDFGISVRTVPPRDPLAQTFYIEQEGGVFIRSIDIYFAQKDNNIPITIEIRNVVNGYPGLVALPLATKTLQSSDVNFSSDASVATTFTFDAPIYLENAREYSFVLIANTVEYLVWVSRVGDVDVTTGERISKQPSLGSLFKSQNASTWTPDQDLDVKFTIKRCSFNTSVVGSALFNNSNLNVVALPFDCLSTTSGSNNIEVNVPNHNLIDGNEITLSGFSGIYNNIPDTELNGTHTATVIDYDNVQITVTTNADTTGKTGGTNITSSKNIRVNVVNPLFETLNFPETIIASSMKIANNVGNLISSYIPVTLKENTTFSDEMYIYSTDNEPVGGSTAFKFDFASDNESISPVIDTERASLITISNRINNDFTNETNSNSGNGIARYITKNITLSTSAIGMRVYFAALRPTVATIKVYLKRLNDDNPDGVFENQEYEEMNIVQYPSASVNQYRDYIFELQDLEPFSNYAIKIVMLSSDTSEPPLIKDFRTIATGT